MGDEAEAEPLRDLGLEGLNLLGAELDHVPRREVHEVVMVLPRGALVAGAAVAKRQTLYDALVLEQLDRPIDGRERDAVVDGGSATMELDDVRMVLRLP